MLENSLSLPRPVANQILAHAIKQPGEEICGLLARSNDDDEDFQYYPVANVANDSARRFEMDSKQQIDAMRTMRDREQSLIAIVHSHPDATAKPSSIDIELNEYQDVYTIIISLNTKGVLDMRCFMPTGGEAMQEVELELMHET